MEDEPIKMPEIKPKVARQNSKIKPDSESRKNRDLSSLPMLTHDVEPRKSELEPAIEQPASLLNLNPRN